MATVISIKDTAKIARRILKEAFPGTKFSVKSTRSTHMPVLEVSWIDGPTKHQVESYLDRLCGTFYDCSGQEHRRRSRKAKFNGHLVDFEPEIITYSRQNSDTAVTRAITAYNRYYTMDADLVTLNKFRTGSLYMERRDGAEWTIQQEVRFMVDGRSTVGGKHSTTATKIEIIQPAPQARPGPKLDLHLVAQEICNQVSRLPQEQQQQFINQLIPNELGVIKTQEIRRIVSEQLRIKSADNVVCLH